MYRLSCGLGLSILCFTFTLNAVESKQQVKKPRGFQLSPKDYTKVFVGAGVTIGNQKVDADINSRFEAQKSSFSSTTYGGTVAIGYNYNFRNTNFIIGVEVGADLGKQSSSVVLGGKFRTDSDISLRYRYDYLLKESIICQSITQIADQMKNIEQAHEIWGTTDTLLNKEAFRKFICSMRYLGGASDSYYNSTFMNSSTSGGGLDNENANFIDFIGEPAYNNIRTIGNGDIRKGYENVREFLTNNYPHFANTLTHLTEINMVNTDNNEFCSGIDSRGEYIYPEDPYKDGEISERLSKFFDGPNSNDNDLYYESLGIAHDEVTTLNENILKDIDNIYNPDNSAVNIHIAEDELRRLSNLNHKVDFGICPYFAVKLGYFISDFQSNFYMKLGITQLKGKVESINNFIGVNQKFTKSAPFLGCGVYKLISRKLGIAAEYTQTLKVKHKLNDIELYGYRIKNEVSLSKANFRVIATYNL